MVPEYDQREQGSSQMQDEQMKEKQQFSFSTHTKQSPLDGRSPNRHDKSVTTQQLQHDDYSHGQMSHAPSKKKPKNLSHGFNSANQSA